MNLVSFGMMIVGIHFVLEAVKPFKKATLILFLQIFRKRVSICSIKAFMEKEYEDYTSECGKIIVRLIAGLDKRTVGILLTQALKDFPDTIDMLRHGGLFQISVSPVKYEKH